MVIRRIGGLVRSRFFAVGGTLILASVSAWAAGCGSDTSGTSCSVQKGTDGTTTISCTDGTKAVVKDAAPDATCTVAANPDGSKTITCSDGTTVTVRDADAGAGPNGPDGSTGPTGPTKPSFRIDQFHGTDRLLQDAFDKSGKYFATAAVTSATADAAGVVTVNFTVATQGGAPKPVAGILKSASSYSIAKLTAPATDEVDRRWVPYIYRTETVTGSTFPMPNGTKTEQGYSENTGTFTDHGDGSYTYVFSTNLSSVTTPVTGTAIGYARNLKHRVSVMLGGQAGPTATATFDFVPDGSANTDTRAIIETATCRSCHGNELFAHDGDRLTVESCVTCHGPTSKDAQSGNTLDFKVMIHKIHAGSELASIPGPDGKVWDDPATLVNESTDNGSYAIYGDGDKKHEWWKVGFPAVLTNCTKCHTGSGADVDNWKTKPSRAACGACHDNTSFDVTIPAGMVPHPGGARSTDTVCSTCHIDSGPITSVLKPIPAEHDWTAKDARNTMDYTPELTVSTPANGQYFVAGESPVVTLKLRDNDIAGTPYILDHNVFADDAVTSVPPGNGPEGCVASGCPPKDGKFTSASLFVSGPRARRNPVLTTKARAVIKSSVPEPLTGFNLNFPNAALGLKIDGGWDLLVVNAADQDSVQAGSISVPVFASAVTGTLTVTSGTNPVTDANQTLLGTLRTWRDHQWAGWSVKFTDKTIYTGVTTQTVNVIDNVGATLVLDAALTLDTTHALTYAMTAQASTYSGGVTAVPSSTTVSDASNINSRDHQFKGFTFKVISGTGAGQSVAIVDNAFVATPAPTMVLTLASALATQPDTTSVYMIAPFANVGQAKNAEIVNWLNANAAFNLRAIGYMDQYLSVTTGAIAQTTGTTFTVPLGDGAIFAASGRLVLDKGTATEEQLTYTRVNDTFTTAAPAFAHTAGTKVAVPCVSIRSRNRGNFFAIQAVPSSVNTVVTAVFASEAPSYPVHVLGSNTPGATDTKGTSSTVGNTWSKQTDPTKNDPKAAWFADKMTYTLDAVDDLQPGIYIAKIEFADRGTIVADVNYKAPTVARVKFQVGSGPEELSPASNCGSCHTTGNDVPSVENMGGLDLQKGFVVDYPRHNKLLNNTAVDLCGNCHDYQPQNPTGDWSGAFPISRRVHSVHSGDRLNYPTLTDGHSDTVPGRNWDITFPQDVRNCQTCHPSDGVNATSGTWRTKAARIPCSGCHDADPARAHFKAMTWDPTPLDAYSGDEVESCQNCH